MRLKTITIIISALCIAISTACIAQSKETVTIDLATDEGPVTYRASGFLHAMTKTTPGPELVDPLKPQCFRMCAEDWHHIGAGAFANYDRVKRLGAKMQVVVSDSHGYGLAGWWPGDNGDWKPWEMLCESLVKRAQAAGCDFEWDIWNEPNIGYFWQRDQQKLFETWKVGAQKIRSLDPKAVLIGPSLSWFDAKYIEAFLLYAKENKVLPDVLAWHEMGSPDKIPQHAARMRLFMSRNGIDIKRISLNEIIGGDRMLKPGATVRFFAAIERAGVESACHACWNDKDQGVSGCENQSLDGILTHPDRKPRASWWAYKGYADITGQLVELKREGNVDGVAGKDPKTKTVRVLVGRDSKTTENVDVRFTNLKSIDYLVKNGKVRVLIQRIPSSGWDALDAPEEVAKLDYMLNGDELIVQLKNFGPSDAYTITLSK